MQAFRKREISASEIELQSPSPPVCHKILGDLEWDNSLNLSFFNNHYNRSIFAERAPDVDATREWTVILSKFAIYVLECSSRVSFTLQSKDKNEALMQDGHQFVVKTYYRPTFCSHCDKMLYGIVRQACIIDATQSHWL